MYYKFVLIVSIIFSFYTGLANVFQVSYHSNSVMISTGEGLKRKQCKLICNDYLEIEYKDRTQNVRYRWLGHGKWIQETNEKLETLPHSASYIAQVLTHTTNPRIQAPAINLICESGWNDGMIILEFYRGIQICTLPI